MTERSCRRRPRGSRAIAIAVSTAAALLGAGLGGCSVPPAEQQAIRDAWAARDAERAAECRQHNVGFAAGGCVAGGP